MISDDCDLHRDPSGALSVRVVAPLAPVAHPADPRDALFALQLLSPDGRTRALRQTTDTAPAELVTLLHEITPRYRPSRGRFTIAYPDSPTRALARLAQFGTRAARAEQAIAALDACGAAPAVPHLDLDEAIMLGESELANATRASSDLFWRRWVATTWPPSIIAVRVSRCATPISTAPYATSRARARSTPTQSM